MLIIVATLAACGFHLRGDSQIPAELNPLYLEPGQLDSAQLTLIRTSLKKASVYLTGSPQDSNRLRIKLTELKSRKVAGSRQSSVERVQLSMGIEYSIQSSSGELLVENRQITQSRDVELDTANVLSQEQTMNKSQQNLQQSLVQSMIFQLSH